MGSKLAPLLCLCLISGNVLAVSGQKPAAAPRLAIDADRPFVCLKFVRYGPGIPFGENEPKQRIWFRFVNNCNVPVTISTFGVPDGSPADEVGVMDHVVRDEHGGFDVEVVPPPPMPEFPPVTSGTPPPPRVVETRGESGKMPFGYWFEVGSSDTIPPGKAVLFSIPTNHLGKDWHMEIPFSFKEAPGHCCRDSNVWGGQPEMNLSYSQEDLPDRIQVVLKK
jgi:hypothetical protein